MPALFLPLVLWINTSKPIIYLYLYPLLLMMGLWALRLHLWTFVVNSILLYVCLLSSVNTASSGSLLKINSYNSGVVYVSRYLWSHFCRYWIVCRRALCRCRWDINVIDLVSSVTIEKSAHVLLSQQTQLTIQHFMAFLRLQSLSDKFRRMIHHRFVSKTSSFW